MPKKLDLTNKKFGRITVLAFHSIGTDKCSTWKCICDCGNEKIIRGACLTRGTTQSCGCWKKEINLKHNKENALPSGEAQFNIIYNSYKKRALRKKLEFELTKIKFKELTQKNCFYCNSSPNNIPQAKLLNGTYIYNGIDRIDNNLGYTILNSAPCCKFCNAAKTNLSKEQFLFWIEKVYNTSIKKL